MAFTRCILTSCLAGLVAGLRRQSQRSNRAKALAEDCGQLENLTVREVKVGMAAHTVCKYWPERLGQFPIQNIDRAMELFEYGLGNGGLYDQLKEVARERGESSKFCWRGLDRRDFATCEGCSTTTTTTCFQEDIIFEPDMAGQSKSQEPSEEWCQKRCSLVSGCKHFSYWTWGDDCHLQDASAKSKKMRIRNTWAGPPSCPGAAAGLSQLNSTEMVDESEALIFHRRRRSAPAGCEVYSRGQCYGNCPSGYEPTKLLKIFAPVCKTQCATGPLTFRCGFGCADDRRSCFDATWEQVSQVVNSVAIVAGYLTGNPVISKVAEKILQLVEFVISTLWSLVQFTREQYKNYQESETVFAFLSTFAAYIFENAEQIGQTVETAKALFGEVIGFWLEMLDEGFKFTDAPLQKIAEAFGKHGEEILTGAGGLIKAFIYPKCADLDQ